MSGFLFGPAGRAGSRIPRVGSGQEKLTLGQLRRASMPRAELSTGRVGPRVRSGWVGSGCFVNSGGSGREFSKFSIAYFVCLFVLFPLNLVIFAARCQR